MRYFLSVAAGLAVTLMAPPVAAAPTASDASVRLPVMAGRPAAGFVMVMSDKPDVLTGVASPKAGRIEMHSVVTENGVMRMRQESSMAVPAGGMLHMAPGGNHLMLFDLSPGLQAGDMLPLTLSFQSGAKVTVNASVVAPGTMPEAHGNQKH